MKKIITREEAVTTFGQDLVEFVDRLNAFETNRQGFFDQNGDPQTEWESSTDIIGADGETVWLTAVYYTPDGVDENLIIWEVDHYVVD